MNNKSADEIEEYILNMNSYSTKAEITINTNKNTNKYLVTEQFNKQDNVYRKEVLEPENISGMVFIYDGSTLSIKNTNLNLSSIYENYQELSNNNLSLKSFIEDYVKDNESKIYEENNMIILEAKTENLYNAYKKLYINKDNGKPIKIEIEDISHKPLIYILYNEIEINNIKKEDILAFNLELQEYGI